MTLLDPDQIVFRERRVRMTEEEFFATLDGVHAEYVDGEAIFMSPVSLLHSELNNWLIAVTQVCATDTSAGRVFSEPVNCRIPPGKTRSPDLCFVATANASILTPNLIDGAPDLIMEIVSPESRHRDYREKFADYETGGVKEYWIFDPFYETVDLHRLNEAGKYQAVPLGKDTYHQSSLLPHFEFSQTWMLPGKLPRASQRITEILAKIAGRPT